MTAKGLTVTLSDIAQRLGVSKVTVSKALRGHPDISPGTVQAVKRLAREMRYYPNHMARSLSSKKSNTIGVVVPKIAHFFFSSVIEALYTAALSQGYEILLTVSQENAELEQRHIQSLLSMRVDGLIVSLSENTRDYEVYGRLRDMGVPLTFMDRVVEDGRFARVVVDDFGGAFAATEQAIRVGYRRLAHLGGYEYTSIGQGRYRGFAAALEKHGIPVNQEWVVQGGFGESDGYVGFMKFMERDELPEFVFAATFPIAFGVYRAADELGLRIPRDIDIICFGNSGMNQFLSPPISYVEQPTRELAVNALELTLAQIRSKESSPPVRIELPTRLVLSKTCIDRSASLTREQMIARGRMKAENRTADSPVQPSGQAPKHLNGDEE
jgi:LacI family transcriptional regulator